MAAAHQRAEDARHSEGAYSVGDVTVSVPECPSGVSISDNIEFARYYCDNIRFYYLVKNGGLWDYKQQGSQYEDLVIIILVQLGQF